jgi:glycosyltransferase involved in cell wall biosynthesis
MRMLHLIPHLSGGGAERQLSYLAPEMAKVGHEVHIAYLREGPESVLLPGVTLHRLDVSRNHDPRLFLELSRVIGGVKPHIVQSWIPMMDIAVGLVSLATSVTWVLREPTSDAAYQNFGFKQELRAWLVRRASAIVANSPGGRSYWLGKGIPDQRLFIIPNAVPLDLITGVEPTRHKCENRKVLIYAGRLIPSKNIEVIVKAMVEVRQRQEVLLYIVGDGPSEPHLRSLVERLQLRDHIRFTGFLQSRDLWAHMKGADAFISLSTFEGMPNCVCEAAACGIPLILSDIPAHRDFLDLDAALLIPVDSPTRVAEAVWRTLNNSQDGAQRAARRLEAIRSWTSELIAAEYIRLYERLVG